MNLEGLTGLDPNPSLITILGTLKLNGTSGSPYVENVSGCLGRTMESLEMVLLMDNLLVRADTILDKVGLSFRVETVGIFKCWSPGTSIFKCTRDRSTY